MANPIKGEVSREIGGKKYTFVLGTYALAALERRMHMPWHKVFKRASDGDWGMDEVLAILHAGLLRHHPQMTEMQASDLIDEAGIVVISEMIGEAARLMQPEGAAGDVPIPENPMQPGNGQAIGMNS